MALNPEKKLRFSVPAVCVIFQIMFFLALIAGCGKYDNRAIQNSNGKINVMTSVFAPYDFVRNIAADKVNLFMLLPPGSESHSFDPSPADINAIQRSDVFIYSGGESEKWVDRILDVINTDRIKILPMMDIVNVVEEETVEGMEAENEQKDPHGNSDNYDEHVWTSPKNAILIVLAITKLLCETDLANAAFYQQNAAVYAGKLAELDGVFESIVCHAKRKTIVFGDRFPFRYFTDSYGLKYFAAFPGCSAETEPNAATVAFLITKIRDENIPVVFHIELSNERMADTISLDTGAEKLLLHACHNIAKSDFDSGLGYLDFMQSNAKNLREALY